MKYRCTAFPDKLDNSDTIQCSEEHTAALREALGDDLKLLWEGYGIIGDLVVRFYNFCLL